MDILEVLKRRFNEHPVRHPGLKWEQVEACLLRDKASLAAIVKMEESGGEPDVVGVGESAGFVFMDCSIETPKGRRNCCYDEAARLGRKKFAPEVDAVSLAAEMGVEILDEVEYRYLQTLGSFDMKTSSWIKTPPSIREMKGALFCDFRYGKVFVYHNGADSYYAVRGFRAKREVKPLV